MDNSTKSTLVTKEMVLNASLNHDRLIRGKESPKNMDDIIKDLDKLREFSVLHPEDYKGLKSTFLHDDTQAAGIITEVFNTGYDRNSHLFNTMLRCNNDLRISSKAIRDIKMHEIPPAFDDSMMSDKYDYKDTLDLIKSRKVGTVNKIIDAISKEFDIMGREDGYDIILTNGSTTGIQDEGMNILDINSIGYQAPQWFLDKFDYLIKQLTINNYSYNMLDCPIESDSILGGEILHIPDKEFKIRSIYRMYWFVQILSKRLHAKLDTVARKIPGNFTYNHRKWLYDIIEEGYNKNKYILTTDMSKYSDTLSIDFMFDVLAIAIKDKEVVRQMKELYSLPVVDNISKKVFDNPNGTYQGQYGDFPLITIMNCILQRIVYYRSGQKIRKGYLAAVGDDTGFIFDTYDLSLMQSVIDTYGSVGVQINRSKTHELIDGSGYGDFVKIEISGEGLVDFFNISNAYNNNVDGFIRDIYDSYLIHKNVELLEADFSSSFGNEIGLHLTNLSVINGGVMWNTITQEDIKLFKKRLVMVKQLNNKNVDDLRVWYDFYKETISSNEVSITSTPFVGWFNEESYRQWVKETSNASMDDFIEGRIFNSNLIGHDPRLSKISINDLVGLDLKAVKYKLDNDLEIDESVYQLLELINSYENKEACRRRRSKVKNISSYITTYALTKIDGELPNYLPTGIYIKDHKEYTVKQDRYRRLSNQMSIGMLAGVYMDGPFWGNYYYRFSDGSNIYNIERRVDSKYPFPSMSLWCKITGTDEEFYNDMMNGV